MLDVRAWRATDAPPVENPSESMAPKRRFGKKLYAVVVAVALIVVILVSAFFIPRGAGDVISLGVDYSVGEKLTYNVAVDVSFGLGNVSSTANESVTMTVEVLSLDGNVYTLKYTAVVPAGLSSTTTSKVIQVQKSEMITLLALMPVVLQSGITEDAVGNAPLLAAVFDKSQAKVGDTWQVPINPVDGSSEESFEPMTITFTAIKDATVPAGTFRVFSFDFSTSAQNQTGTTTISADLTGQAQLEMGSCKQVQSTLDMTISMEASGLEYTLGMGISTTLTQDSKP